MCPALQEPTSEVAACSGSPPQNGLASRNLISNRQNYEQQARTQPSYAVHLTSTQNKTAGHSHGMSSYNVAITKAANPFPPSPPPPPPRQLDVPQALTAYPQVSLLPLTSSGAGTWDD